MQGALDWLAARQDKDVASQALQCSECDKRFADVAMAQLHATKTGHQDFCESEEALPQLTPEQKTAKLAELRARLAERRETERIRHEQEAKQAELMRRKSAYTTAQAKKELQDRELVKAAEQLRKDREEEKTIRARIRAEMAEEKRVKQQEAEAAAQKAHSEALASDPQPLVLLSDDSEAVRLQIKLPGGESIKGNFRADDRLALVLDLIRDRIGAAADTHSQLVVPFPRKTIDLHAEAGKSLRELGLSPSASLILQ